MENKRGTTVLLTVIGIATLLVAVVGATFAYFTASVTTDESSDLTEVTIQTATLGNVTYYEGNLVELGNENAYPNAMVNKDFSLTSQASSVDYNYTVYMDITHDFLAAAEGSTDTNMQYQVCEVTDGQDCATPAEGSWVNVKTTDGQGTEIVAKTAMGVSADAEVTRTYRVWVRLKETGAPQNADQGKSFTGALRVEVENLDGKTGYTTDSQGNQVTTNLAG